MKLLAISCLMVVASVTLAADPKSPKDCITVESKDGFSLITNRCSSSVNILWLYEGGECASGCTQKLAAKGYFYATLFKEPYTLAACYAPAQVDPKWRGFGVAACK